MTATGDAFSSSNGRASAWGPLLFVPTAYFLQGLPYNVVTGTSQLLLQDLGVEKAAINVALGSMLLVWSLKPLWAPLVDGVGTKRAWTLGTQALGTALLVALGLLSALPGGEVLRPAVLVLWGMALVSATHDIALDGFYMLALEPRMQALLAGLRTAAWRLSLVFATGALVAGVGALRSRLGYTVPESWRAGLLAAAALMGALTLLHALLLPRPAADRPAPRAGALGLWLEGFGSYFRQPGALRLVGFILLSRLAETLLTAMAKLFLRDPVDKGGMGLSLEEVGLVYGTIGVVALLSGGVLGGAAVARWGLRRTVWPLGLVMHLPDALFLFLAWRHADCPLWLTGALVGGEQLGFGLGSGAFAVVLLRAARPPFRTTHYAISTGIMTLGVSAATLASGYLQLRLGYVGYFGLVCALAVPSFAAIALLRGVPLEE